MLRCARYFTTLLFLLALAGPVAADDCYIVGEITAEENFDDPDMGGWVYTLFVEWDTGTPHGLSHFNLILDVEFGECTCDDFEGALNWADPAGYSTGYDSGEPCTVDYQLFFECNGDPSVPDINEPLLKFEPIEVDGCEPGPVGEGTFTFYSDYPPAEVAEYNTALVDKYSGEACFGSLSGVFPALPCDPTGDLGNSWGAVKALFR